MPIEAGLEVEFTAEEAQPLDDTAEHVLGTWRELDRQQPPNAPYSPSQRDPSTLVAGAEPGDVHGVPALHGSARPAGASGLAAAEIDGLDAALAARLAELGIRSPKELVAAAPLELARALPLPFTRVQRLQFLAGRHAADAPPPAPPVPTAPPARRHPLAPGGRDLGSDQIETAGPFA